MTEVHVRDVVTTIAELNHRAVSGANLPPLCLGESLKSSIFCHGGTVTLVLLCLASATC